MEAGSGETARPGQASWMTTGKVNSGNPAGPVSPVSPVNSSETAPAVDDAGTTSRLLAMKRRREQDKRDDQGD